MAYKVTMAKANFAHIQKMARGWAIRFNATEFTEGEGADAVVKVLADEEIVTRTPTYEDIVEMLIRRRYSVNDELAIVRKSLAEVSGYMEYNAYVEQCRREAHTILGTEYVPNYTPTLAEVMSQLIALVKPQVDALPDDKAVSTPSLFEPWKPGENATAGLRRYFGGKLYKCAQPHRTQVGWEPDKTPALWTEVPVGAWPAWVRPVGAQDAYDQGAQVSHNGNHWVSDVANNVWEPGVYGWTMQ